MSVFKERYHNDPEFRETVKARSRKRYNDNPEYRAKKIARQIERYESDRDLRAESQRKNRERYWNEVNSFDYEKLLRRSASNARALQKRKCELETYSPDGRFPRELKLRLFARILKKGGDPANKLDVLNEAFAMFCLAEEDSHDWLWLYPDAMCHRVAYFATHYRRYTEKNKQKIRDLADSLPG